MGEDIHWLNWSADSKLLASSGARLWLIGTDGKNPTQLISDPNADISDLANCDSRYIVFSWRFHEGANFNIWRVNADGSNPVRLTSGQRDRDPVCSPDHEWVYYRGTGGGNEEIYRVRLDGSAAAELLPGSINFHGYLLMATLNIPVRSSRTVEMSISSDGKLLAYAADQVSGAETTESIALLNLESPVSPRLIPTHAHRSGGVQFTPGGNTVAYPIRENGIDNLWLQPLDGSAGRQITHFTSDQIDAFHWSPDGKNLSLLRSHSESDVVLLQESKP
jgi:Tol biopolymer transport system component